jgi:hypothetical protein
MSFSRFPGSLWMAWTQQYQLHGAFMTMAIMLESSSKLTLGSMAFFHFPLQLHQIQL